MVGRRAFPQKAHQMSHLMLYLSSDIPVVPAAALSERRNYRRSGSYEQPGAKSVFFLTTGGPESLCPEPALLTSPRAVDHVTPLGEPSTRRGGLSPRDL